MLLQRREHSLVLFLDVMLQEFESTLACAFHSSVSVFRLLQQLFEQVVEHAVLDVAFVREVAASCR